MEDQAGLLAEKTLRAKCSAGMYNFSPKARNMRRRLDALESLLIEAYSLPRRDPRTVTVRSRMSDSIQEFTLHAFQVEGYRCRLPFIRLFFSIVLPNKDKPSSHEVLFIPEWDSSAQQDQQEQEDGIFKYPLILFRATDKAMHVVEQWLEQAFDCYLVNLSFQRPVMEGLLEDWKFHLVDTPPTEDMRIKVPNVKQKEIAGVTIEYEFKEAELSHLRFTFGTKQIIDIHKKLTDNKLTLIDAFEAHLHRVVRIKAWKLKMARITLDDFSIQHDGTLKFINGLPRTNLIRYLKRLTTLKQPSSHKWHS